MRSAVSPRSWIGALVFALLVASAAAADTKSYPPPLVYPTADPAARGPMVPARDLTFEQKLDVPVPLDAELVGEDGQAITLGQAMAGKPTVLALVYYGCPRVCGLVLEGSLRSLKYIEGLDAGRDFQLVAVSFDPRESPALAQKARLGAVKFYDRPTAREGLRFLTGTAANVRRIADAIGFSYRWDESSKQYAHPAGIVVLTPAGRTARYFFGIDYPNKDLKLSLVEASAGRIGSIIDQVLLYCYGFDESAGRYTLIVMRIVRAGGVLMVLALVLTLFILRRRERSRAREAA